MKKDITLVLENLRSVYNVGSIFRTAASLGVRHIVCIGTTPTPLDRFGTLRSDFCKVSLGAENMVLWKYATSFKREEYSCVCVSVEQVPEAVAYHRYSYPDPVALVFGSETDGVSKETLDACNASVHIPMAEFGKESLNVSVACGIVLSQCIFND